MNKKILNIKLFIFLYFCSPVNLLASNSFSLNHNFFSSLYSSLNNSSIPKSTFLISDFSNTNPLAILSAVGKNSSDDAIIPTNTLRNLSEIANPEISEEQAKKQRVKAFIVFFLGISVFIFGFIFSSRIYKLYCKNRSDKLRKKYELLLMDVLFNEGNEEDEIRTTKIVKHFKEYYLHNPFNRSVLLAELIRLHKNFSGNFAQNLKRFFLALGFEKDSYQKIHSSYWHKKAQGIGELANMNVKHATPIIQKYVNHSHELVRMEAQLALVKLADENVFDFLTDVINPLSDWQQLNLQQVLSTKSRDQVPEFKTWLRSDNPTVVAFSVKMIGLYNQVEAIPALLGLLLYPNKPVRKATISALKKLDAVEAPAILEKIFSGEEKELQLDILQALESISAAANQEFLEGLLSSDDFDIRLTAAKILIALNTEESTYLQGLLETEDEELQHIIAHALDTRI